MYAAVNHFQERGSQLSVAEKETYVEDLTGSPADADTFSRELTDSEKERRKILMEKYLQEGLYPARKLLRIQAEGEIVADRVCFLLETSTFYLPERELTDEDLLEIIDHDLMTDYSLAEARKEEQKAQQAMQGQQDAQGQQAAQGQQSAAQGQQDAQGQQSAAQSQQGAAQDQQSAQGSRLQQQNPEELSMEEAITYAKKAVERVYGENTEDMEVTAEYDSYIVDGVGEPFSDAMIYLTKEDGNTQYYVCVDLIRKEVNILDINNEQEDLAENCIEPGNIMEKELLKNIEEITCRFMGEGVSVNKRYAQVITDPEGYLAYGVIHYYFEMDNGKIADVSYSNVTKRIYSLWSISQDLFDEDTEITKTQYKKDGYTYQLIKCN